MHQAKAMATQAFSALCAGFHQMPFGESSPVCVSRCMGYAEPQGRREIGRCVISQMPQPVYSTKTTTSPAASRRKMLSKSRWPIGIGTGEADGPVRSFIWMLRPSDAWCRGTRCGSRVPHSDPGTIASDRGHDSAPRRAHVMTSVIRRGRRRTYDHGGFG